MVSLCVVCAEIEQPQRRASKLSVRTVNIGASVCIHVRSFLKRRWRFALLSVVLRTTQAIIPRIEEQYSYCEQEGMGMEYDCAVYMYRAVLMGLFLKALAPIFTVRTLNLFYVTVVLSPHDTSDTTNIGVHVVTR